MLKLTIAALAAMLLTACGSPEKRTEKQQKKNDFVRRLYPTAAPRSVRSRTVPPGDGRHDRRKLHPGERRHAGRGGNQLPLHLYGENRDARPRNLRGRNHRLPAAAGAGRGENREDHAVVAPPAALCKYSCRMSAWFSAAFFEA